MSTWQTVPKKGPGLQQPDTGLAQPASKPVTAPIAASPIPTPPAPPSPLATPPSASTPRISPPAAPLTSPAPMPAGMTAAPPGSMVPTTMPAPPRIPSVGSSFGPGNDLRATQINPTPSARLTAAQGMTGQAAQRVQAFDPTQATLQGAQQVKGLLTPRAVGFQGVGTDVAAQGINPTVAGGPAVDPTQSARFGQAANRTDQAAQQLAGVDRFGIAKQRLAQFNAEQAPVAEAERRNLLKGGAAMGRLGSGMLRTSFGDLADRLDLNRRGAETRFLTEALEGSIGDQFNKTSALAGLEGQVYGQDAGLRGERRVERDYTTGLGERNVARQTNERDTMLGLAERNVGRRMSERDARLGLDERNVGREFDAARTAVDAGMGLSDRQGQQRRTAYDVAGDYEGGIAAQDLLGRNELRGERDYQGGMENQAFQRALQQFLTEQAAQAQQFGQGATAAGIGYGGNPSGQLAQGAQTLYGQAQGAYDPLVDALSNWGRKKEAA